MKLKYLAFSSFVGVLVAFEIIVFNEEILLLFCFLNFVFFSYLSLNESISKVFNDRLKDIDSAYSSIFIKPLLSGFSSTLLINNDLRKLPGTLEMIKLWYLSKHENAGYLANEWITALEVLAVEQLHFLIASEAYVSSHVLKSQLNSVYVWFLKNEYGKLLAL